tara:strand:+ start:641 stop:1111 length:471 start_codon:yes stop_codon:yes gene_type:complete
MNTEQLEQRLKFCEGQLYTLNTLVSQSQIHTEKINELIEQEPITDKNINTLFSQCEIHKEYIRQLREQNKELSEKIDKLTLDKESEEIDNSIEENIKELQKKKRKQKKKEWNNKTRLCECCNIQVKNNGWGKHNKTKKHLRNKGAYLVNDSDTIDE